MDLIKDLFYWFYLLPLYGSLLYFTILKIEDIYRPNKVFSKDKYTYKAMLIICFIPVINIAILFIAIYKCLKK